MNISFLNVHFLAEQCTYKFRNMIWELNTLHLTMTTLFLSVMVQSVYNINDIRIKTYHNCFMPFPYFVIVIEIDI